MWIYYLLIKENNPKAGKILSQKSRFKKELTKNIEELSKRMKIYIIYNKSS